MTKGRRVHQAVSTLPLANSMGVLCLFMWSVTCVASVLNFPITDGWYAALCTYTVTVGGVFGVKRWTFDPQKAQAAAALSAARPEGDISP